MAQADFLPSLPYHVKGYHLDREIGKGGFGRVYHATSDKYPDYAFAIKVTEISGESVKQEAAYKAEIEALQRLDHSNVVNLYDCFSEGNFEFAVLEYCPNGTLKERLNGKIPVQEQIRIAGQIVSALNYCHQNHICHRDIKSSNILFDAHDRAKVADFGLCQIMADLELSHCFNGSYLYSAPELWKKQDYDPFAADIWSLGVLFYEIVNGHCPWPTESKQSVKNAVMTGTYNIVNATNPLMQLVKKMIVVDPSMRITMAEIEEMNIWPSRAAPTNRLLSLRRKSSYRNVADDDGGFRKPSGHLRMGEMLPKSLITPTSSHGRRRATNGAISARRLSAMEMTEADVLVDIKELQAAHSAGALNTFTDHSIRSSSQQLRSLEAKKAKLTEELASLQQTLEAAKRINEEEQNKPQYTREIKGNFFQQLRQIEAEIEDQENMCDGERAVISNLKGELGVISAKNRKLRKQRDALTDQIRTMDKAAQAKQTELARKNAELQKLDNERDTLFDFCESMKNDTKQLSAECQEITPEIVQELMQQKLVLENEIRNKKEELETARNAEKSANSHYTAKQRIKQKELDSKLSPMNWMSERAALVAKVKKARQEIAALEVRERGAVNAENYMRTTREELNGTPDEIKKALIAEMQALPKQVPEFLSDAILVEKRHEQKLRKQMRETEEASNRVSAGTEQNQRHMTSNETAAGNGPRIELLKAELQELRRML